VAVAPGTISADISKIDNPVIGVYFIILFSLIRAIVVNGAEQQVNPRSAIPFLFLVPVTCYVSKRRNQSRINREGAVILLGEKGHSPSLF
jgi:hypothetical protein